MSESNIGGLVKPINVNIINDIPPRVNIITNAVNKFLTTILFS